LIIPTSKRLAVFFLEICVLAVIGLILQAFGKYKWFFISVCVCELVFLALFVNQLLNSGSKYNYNNQEEYLEFYGFSLWNFSIIVPLLSIFNLIRKTELKALSLTTLILSIPLTAITCYFGLSLMFNRS
jgi:hypothetical protein